MIKRGLDLPMFIRKYKNHAFIGSNNSKDHQIQELIKLALLMN